MSSPNARLVRRLRTLPHRYGSILSWGPQITTGNIQDNAIKRQLYLSRFCRDGLLPGHVIARLKGSQYRDILTSNAGSTVSLPWNATEPLRLFMDTGVELRLYPKDDRLEVKVIYHVPDLLVGRLPQSKPFLAFVVFRTAEHVLDTTEYRWPEILKGPASAHERMDFYDGLGSRDFSQARAIDATTICQLDLVTPFFMFRLVQPLNGGFCFGISSLSGGDPITPFFAPLSGSLETNRTRLEDLTRSVDILTGELPSLQRSIALQVNDFNSSHILISILARTVRKHARRAWSRLLRKVLHD